MLKIKMAEKEMINYMLFDESLIGIASRELKADEYSGGLNDFVRELYRVHGTKRKIDIKKLMSTITNDQLQNELFGQSFLPEKHDYHKELRECVFVIKQSNIENEISQCRLCVQQCQESGAKRLLGELLVFCKKLIAEKKALKK